MASPVGSFLNIQGPRILEVINKQLTIFAPTFDKVWEDVISSSIGVGRADEMGRDFKILKTFMGSLAGVIEPAGPRADFPIYGDNSNQSLGSKVMLQGLTQTFPSPLGGANAVPYRLGIPMRALITNLLVTLGELSAEANPNIIGTVLAPKFVGFARNLALTMCNYWYVSQNNYYRLTYLAGGSGTGWDKTVDTNTTLMVDTKYSDYAVMRFQVGQRVSFYDSTGATIRSTATGQTVFVCVRSDGLTGKVWFKAEDGNAVSGASFADNDICVMAGSKGSSTTPFSSSPYFTGIAGVNSWLKFGSGGSDNYLLGAERDSSNEIDVTVHPEFKSFLKNMGGDPLTEHELRKILARWHTAKMPYGQYIDTIVMSEGVKMAYLGQKINREYLDRTNKRPSLSNEGDADDMTFMIDGRKYTFYTSPYVDGGTVYGSRRGGGNWKRYTPPDVRGTTRMSEAKADIPFRFVAGAISGTNTNQLPVYDLQGNRVAVTEGSQMPGWLRMQLVPEQAAGLKLTNVGEDRVYSDS